MKLQLTLNSANIFALTTGFGLTVETKNEKEINDKVTRNLFSGMSGETDIELL